MFRRPQLKSKSRRARTARRLKNSLSPQERGGVRGSSGAGSGLPLPPGEGWGEELQSKFRRPADRASSAASAAEGRDMRRVRPPQTGGAGSGTPSPSGRGAG